MTTTLHRLDELAARLASGSACRREDADLVLTETDIVRIGVLGEEARKRVTGDSVTFGRVALVPLAPPGQPAFERGQAGEVRLVGTPTSFDALVDAVSAAKPLAGNAVLTAASLADMLEWAGHDHLQLAELAGALRAAGLDAVAETPIDRLGEAEQIVELLRAVHYGGLATWRVTVDAAPLGARLDLIETVAQVQAQTGAIRAFAPLPRRDAADAPSTGYDDVKTIAVARLRCANIERIQVDWPLYGPKLAQVALAFGANDIDGVAAIDTPELGTRRSAGADMARQIQAAGATAVERDGRYLPRT